jgi:iron-sulfur cluster repair protein YtfE (RIC family)
MSELTNDFSNALIHAHRDLLQHIKKLNDLVNAKQWLSALALRRELELIRDELTEHFRFEEEGGYMSAVVQRQPQMANAIGELRNDHDSLAITLNGFIERIGPSFLPHDEFLSEIHDWMNSLREHETRENRIVQEAFNMEIGGGD